MQLMLLELLFYTALPCYHTTPVITMCVPEALLLLPSQHLLYYIGIHVSCILRPLAALIIQ